MTVSELRTKLLAHPAKELRLLLPSGEQIPAHFHVTEVGFVKKEFIDCGGKIRSEGKCLLQIWVATDTDHRVSSDKFVQILTHGAPVLPTDALPVEIEYNDPGLTHFPLARIEADAGAVTLHLTHKHTDCLAKDVCGVPTEEDENCCSPGGGCC
jgi:hypothetical protein